MSKSANSAADKQGKRQLRTLSEEEIEEARIRSRPRIEQSTNTPTSGGANRSTSSAQGADGSSNPKVVMGSKKIIKKKKPKQDEVVSPRVDTITTTTTNVDPESALQYSDHEDLLEEDLDADLEDNFNEEMNNAISASLKKNTSTNDDNDDDEDNNSHTSDYSSDTLRRKRHRRGIYSDEEIISPSPKYLKRNHNDDEG